MTSWQHVFAAVVPALVGATALAESLQVDPDIIEQVASEEELGVGLRVETRQFDNHVQEQYIQDGRARVIKVTPRNGSPYYLVDPDGNGTMGMRRSTGGSQVSPTRWILRSW
jgi:hypothetical protein